MASDRSMRSGIAALCLAGSVAAMAPADATAQTQAGDGKAAAPAAPAAKPPAPGTAQVTYPPLSRWIENYSSYADPANRKGFWAPIKYVPLGNAGPDFYVTFGGDYRLGYETFDNAAFGLRPVRDDSYFLQRAMLHANVNLGANVRVFAEVADTRIESKDGTVSATDQSRTGLQQGFIDLKGKTAAGKNMFLRVGRQELPLGSSRIIGVADAPNTRRSFDAVRGTFEVGKTNVTAFWSEPVVLGPESFDDHGDDNSTFAGIYTTTALPAAAGNSASLDVFLLDYQRDVATYFTQTGEEKRRSAGARLFGKRGAFDYNWEALYQFGDFAGGDLSAWGVATETGYTFAGPKLKPRLAVRADIASGDDSRSDGELNTFNPLFPRNSWYSLASLTTWSNLKSVYPLVEFAPSKTVKVTAGADFLWRENVNDAVYLTNMGVAPRTNLNTERRIGTTYLLEAVWRPTPAWHIIGQVAHFTAGPAVEVAGGQDTDFFTFRAHYRF